MREYITIPNILTFLRIICALGMVFTPPLGTAFLVLYLMGGISDAIDGTVARLTGTTSRFGARLDSVADLMFYFVMMLKFVPVFLEIVSVHIWYLIVFVVLVRVSTYLFFAIRYKSFLSSHTYLNKLTGFLVFCLPFVINTDFFGKYSVLVSVIAAVAALYELKICVLKK